MLFERCAPGGLKIQPNIFVDTISAEECRMLSMQKKSYRSSLKKRKPSEDELYDRRARENRHENELRRWRKKRTQEDLLHSAEAGDVQQYLRLGNKDIVSRTDISEDQIDEIYQSCVSAEPARGRSFANDACECCVSRSTVKSPKC
jgi:hypothetical protein